MKQEVALLRRHMLLTNALPRSDLWRQIPSKLYKHKTKIEKLEEFVHEEKI